MLVKQHRIYLLDGCNQVLILFNLLLMEKSRIVKILLNNKYFNIMKNIFFLIVIILCFITTGCVKQSNCDSCDEKIGRFVYYEEPQEIIFCAEKTETSGLYITPEG